MLITANPKTLRLKHFSETTAPWPIPYLWILLYYFYRYMCICHHVFMCIVHVVRPRAEARMQLWIRMVVNEYCMSRRRNCTRCRHNLILPDGHFPKCTINTVMSIALISTRIMTCVFLLKCLRIPSPNMAERSGSPKFLYIYKFIVFVSF